MCNQSYTTKSLSLAITGFFRKKGKIKTITFFLIFVLLLISGIRFEKNIFILSLTSKIFFFFTDVIVFVLSYYLNLWKIIFKTNNFINLADFPDLTLRDAEWIELILKETKYETIAKEYNLSEGLCCFQQHTSLLRKRRRLNLFGTNYSGSSDSSIYISIFRLTGFVAPSFNDVSFGEESASVMIYSPFSKTESPFCVIVSKAESGNLK